MLWRVVRAPRNVCHRVFYREESEHYKASGFHRTWNVCPWDGHLRALPCGPQRGHTKEDLGVSIAHPYSSHGGRHLIPSCRRDSSEPPFPLTGLWRRRSHTSLHTGPPTALRDLVSPSRVASPVLCTLEMRDRARSQPAGVLPWLFSSLGTDVLSVSL